MIVEREKKGSSRLSRLITQPLSFEAQEVQIPSPGRDGDAPGREEQKEFQNIYARQASFQSVPRPRERQVACLAR